MLLLLGSGLGFLAGMGLWHWLTGPLPQEEAERLFYPIACMAAAIGGLLLGGSDWRWGRFRAGRAALIAVSCVLILLVLSVKYPLRPAPVVPQAVNTAQWKPAEFDIGGIKPGMSEAQARAQAGPSLRVDYWQGRVVQVEGPVLSRQGTPLVRPGARREKVRDLLGLPRWGDATPEEDCYRQWEPMFTVVYADGLVQRVRLESR